ncbi:hypothetical protein Prudu_013691 [Prunus dulcis]|uniref:Uncharacterized protein n=1 Tax=Prunus dulcis TaxID=3755 RepID=A0A4Y1RFZ6_PRUDU|nr:hypothetical protein Prudu_013691 [Prunus dulcis]
MDGIKYAVFTDKSIRLLGKNQYTSNVESGSTRTEIKHWFELFFGVKKNGTYYGTYNALQTYDHYASTGMAIHLYKTSTPSTRNGAVDSQSNPRNNLIYGQHRCGKGRNARGIITAGIEGEVISVYTDPTQFPLWNSSRILCVSDIWRRSGTKDLFTLLTSAEISAESPLYFVLGYYNGRVVTIEYDPNRNAYICLIHYGDGEKIYILHPRGAIIGDTIVLISSSTSRKPYALEEACTVWEGVLIDQKEESTSTDMPLGTAIHNIEITLGKGGQLARAAGAVAKLIAKEGKSATLKLPSGEVRLISKNCSATVGQVGNVGVNQKSLGKAGSKCWLGKRPVVRGVVMNPVDHPHGGGEGRAPIGRKKPATPWGYPALGRRSRKRNKYSDNLILRRRSK